MNVRFLLALSFTTVLALPVQAQFAINVQQNGQTTSVANGGSITMNAPAPGQTAVATVVLTNVSSVTASLSASAQIIGPSGFTVTGDSASSLSPLQSTTFTFKYSPTSSAMASGQFTWPYSQTSTSGTVTTTTTGVISFVLIGTAPNLTVGEITATGSFQSVASGGTIQFPNTSVNAVSPITIGVSNTGSGPGTVNSITVTGNGYQTGSVPVLPIVINAGIQFNFTIQFQPASPGSAPGSLQIASASGTYTAALSGSGVTSLLSYEITEDGNTSPLNPGQTITIDNTQVGANSTAIIQFQNTGAAAIVLSTVGINGTGFSLTNPPFLPLTLQPQQSSSITVVYTPTLPGPSTGRLQIGNDSFALSSTGLGPLLTFSYQVGGATTSVSPGGTIFFPTVAEGQTASIQFSITNAGTTAASVTSIGIAGPVGVFTLANLVAPSFQLNPAAVATFNINFYPVALGSSTSTLVINNQSFGLTGFSTAPPPLPAYQFTGASGVQQPFTQPAIGLSLSSPYAIALNGTLTITIVSSSFVADPAVQFSSGGLKATFTIPANTLQAVFSNGATQILLQTGTVASTIQITPDFTVAFAGGTDITPANPLTLQLTVPSQAPTLLAASVSAQALTSFTISVAGFATTRSLQNLTFQLKPASGSTLSATAFTVDVSGASTIFFPSNASLAAGGQFVIAVPFTLAQNGASSTANLLSGIGAVSVTATNATGTSNVVQVAIP